MPLTRKKVVTALADPKSNRATKREAIEILSGMKNKPKPSTSTKDKEKKAKKKYSIK